MATSVLREIKAADVSAEDLDTLWHAVEDIYDRYSFTPGPTPPLAEFLTHLIESLRAGNDMVIMAADPAVIAAVAGLNR